MVGVPWTEYIGKDGSHGATWTAGYGQNNRATFDILIDWLDGPEAEADLLGTSIFVPGGEPGTGFLNRTLPVRHPYKPWMLCAAIAPNSKYPLGKNLLDPDVPRIYPMGDLTLAFQLSSV